MQRAVARAQASLKSQAVRATMGTWITALRKAVNPVVRETELQAVSG